MKKRWMSLIEAADWSNIGRKRLIQLAKDKKIVGFSDPDSGRHDWVFDRYSIDAYRETQYNRVCDKADHGKAIAEKIFASLST